MQTAFQNAPNAAVAGQLADISPMREIMSRIMRTRQLLEFIVVGAHDAETYTATIGTTDYEVTAGTGSTTATIAALLIAAINAGSQAVTAREGGTTAKVLVEADDYGDEFAYDADAQTTNALTVSELVEADESPVFGVFVVKDENEGDQGVRLPRASGDITGTIGEGVIRADLTQESPRDATSGAHPVASMIDVIRRGRVWVVAEEAVEVGDDVFVRYASGSGGTQLGAFRSSADTSTAAALKGATWRTAAGAGELAIVEIFPQT